jgi:LPXTG-motif cell wall-anchored protein
VKDCAKGGVDIAAANRGDEAFTFELMGTEYTIPAGESRTVTIPLQEDQAYDFTIKGPGGFTKRFTGTLDCLTQGNESGDATQILSEPSPATAGGGTADDTNLADTGGSSTTPLIAGIAIAFVLIGGAALVLVGKKNAPTQE